jgi:regulator of cell morphogenesis and NO signaling
MTVINFASLPQRTLADIVTGDARTARVFDRLGLDYCCHGQQTLSEAVSDRGLALSDVVSELLALGPREAGQPRDEWNDLSALTRHIVGRHHAYVRDMQPQITAWLAKLVERHGARHPELSDVQKTFAQLSDELLMHMTKEEKLLFPFIDVLVAALRSGSRLPPSPFGTIVNPIRVMETDHESAGDLLNRLRELTRNFEPPPDACTTYRLCYQELEQFEADLHQHVHLENNILFPRAIALEDELS